ncbi:hypothetical protein NC652_009993 [Populus alba x Populus x berolinensis]|nr:hypothetical protein NC652_009993 [Populus alba x Populus x berolinensis]
MNKKRIMTYNGLESCIINNQSYENESGTSRGEGCVSESLDDDGCSSCSSSKDALGSVSSKWLRTKKDEHGLDDWEVAGGPRHFYAKEKPCYSLQYSDVETMKEKFAKLLLGEDITGGRNGLSPALALSNAITNLAGHLMFEHAILICVKTPRFSGSCGNCSHCLEKERPSGEEKWTGLLSPTNYMVELVPAKQNCANGRALEIMTPKARADIHVNLPALQKLDSMLTDTLDSMVNTEFWYSEVGGRAEGRTKSAKESKRWWLHLPQVPTNGLSDSGRTKLRNQSKVVYQVFKAAKSINETILLEMPVPTIIKDALPKSGKANLGEELYKLLTAESNTAEEMLDSLNLQSEHSALEAINKLEAAVFAWKDRMTAQVGGKSPDVGHAILEAYSRVLGNLAFSILSRIADIMQEDSLTNPSSPAATCCFPGINSPGYVQTPAMSYISDTHSSHQMNKGCESIENSNASHISDQELSCSEPRTGSVIATPSRSRVWCIGGAACRTGLNLPSPVSPATITSAVSPHMGVPRFTRPKTPATDSPSPYLYVANCGPAVGISYDTIASVFNTYGEVKGIYAADESGTRVIVSYSEANSAQQALTALNGKYCADLGGSLCIFGIQLFNQIVRLRASRNYWQQLMKGLGISLSKRRVQHYGYEFCYGVNEYPPGVGLSPHIDTHSAFEGLIFSLSLAGPCIMEFRRYLDGSWVPDAASSAYTKVENVDNCSNLVRRSLYLPPRSILLLSGEARYAWQHYIPHHKIDMVNQSVIRRGARRVSFTFRKVKLSLLGDLEVVLTGLVNHFPTRTRTWGHFTGKPLFLIIGTFLNLKPYHLVQTSILFKF